MIDSAELRKTVRNILSEKTSKYDDGVPGKADSQYDGCIEALRALIATGQARTDEDREIVQDAISELCSHQDLGTIQGGKFVPISVAIAARWNILEGKVISGKKFPVFKKESAEKILSDVNGSVYPSDTLWDSESKSVLHLCAFYRRYPQELLCLKSREVSRLGLRELFMQTLQETEV